jgi:outer membrane murein-binding lipoprotein Lpp
MSERDDYDRLRLVIGAIIIACLLIVGIVYYVNWNQAESIRDLQRRIAVLEQERR